MSETTGILATPLTPRAERFLGAVADGYAAAADPARAPAMAAYMRDQFPFLGIATPERLPVLRAAMAAAGTPDDPDLRAIAAACWRRDEREWQYAGCWVLRRWAGRRAEASFVEVVEALVTTRSWWDTVDELARVAGDVVLAHPTATATVVDWIDADDFWLARASLLHQLGYGEHTDLDRLLAACERRMHDREPFIRKAIGWALRQYSRTDPEAVTAFVRAHLLDLSPLSVREALRLLAAAGDRDARAMVTSVGRPRRTPR